MKAMETKAKEYLDGVLPEDWSLDIEFEDEGLEFVWHFTLTRPDGAQYEYRASIYLATPNPYPVLEAIDTYPEVPEEDQEVLEEFEATAKAFLWSVIEKEREDFET